MSEIEVLKARALPIEKIADAYLFGKEVHKGKMFVQVDWIDYDLKEALLALEINESLINDLLLLANMRADDTITGNEIISCLLKNKVNIVQGKDFIWEWVGEQK